MDIFKSAPVIENNSFLFRLVEEKDCLDLLKVYSDENALPFFNSDSCDGDNFYYPKKERMLEAIKFWKEAYEKGWFLRLAIVDKANDEAIGTVEICKRVSNDDFNDMGILRVDVRSDYENERILYNMFSLISPKINEMLGTKWVITKAPIYAVERIEAIKKEGFRKSNSLLVGKDGYAYNGYWIY